VRAANQPNGEETPSACLQKNQAAFREGTVVLISRLYSLVSIFLVFFSDFVPLWREPVSLRAARYEIRSIQKKSGEEETHRAIH
jgi:hypothetical protein